MLKLETADDRFRRFEYDGWQSVSSTYDKYWGPVTALFIPDLLARATGERILDLACGPGHAAAAVAASGRRAVGVDFSPSMIEAARSLHPHIEFLVADVEDMPFADGAFDQAVCNFGFQHFPDIDRAVREIARVVAPGGGIIFSCWSDEPRNEAAHILNGALERCGAAPCRAPKGPDYEIFRSASATERLFAPNGFQGSVRHWDASRVWRLKDPDELYRAESLASVRSGARLRNQVEAVKQDVRVAMMREVRRNCRLADGSFGLRLTARIYEVGK